jgi:hypothetical protein
MDWRDIPGNQRAFDRLRDLVQGGAIAFVGAGASAGLYPLWGGLIRRLADEAVSRGRSTDADRASLLRMSADYPDQVVRGIKAALGDGIYAEALREIFRPRAGPTGNHFSDLHAVLLRLPFKGCITTNFDTGLLEARLALRPDSRATGFATWKDADAIRRWDTGDIFSEQPCPVLFAHGIYDRSDTVVLGAAEYRDAYKTGPFRRRFPIRTATTDASWSARMSSTSTRKSMVLIRTVSGTIRRSGHCCKSAPSNDPRALYRINGLAC